MIPVTQGQYDLANALGLGLLWGLLFCIILTVIGYRRGGGRL